MAGMARRVGFETTGIGAGPVDGLDEAEELLLGAEVA